uniref:Angiotensin-converting enzyme n=1 Tax=Denticeps clupeoides TaxID=299321 RepID=A0AAY4C6R9_9TELE
MFLCAMRVSLFLLVLAVASVNAQSALEERAAEFLRKFDENATDLMYQYSLASWAYNTNITDENSQYLSEQGAIWGDFYSKMSEESQNFPIDQITDPTNKLQLLLLQDKGSGALDTDKGARVILRDMSTIYSTGTVCKLDDPFDCQTLEPGLEEIMANSRDYNERLHVWEGWRVQVGKRMRGLYEEYTDLKNEASRLNGFKDYGDYWRWNYETIEDDDEFKYTRDELMTDVRNIYNEILPLYTELHAYVRAKLQQAYPDHIHPEGGLPAHLLGDMWGRFWTNLYPMSVPYPEKPDIDVTSAMVAQGWTTERMFKEAEAFFMSVGLYKMFDNFWNNSMFVKPEQPDIKVVCHPTAWDMGNREDFRIKMCTKVNMDDFLTVHHEMGHNQYQMAYRNLTYLLRDGANEGFHEAVGEIMSLSAATPSHLKSLGLLPADFTEDKETEINFLLKQALTIVATLPFTYMLEEWRWQVFQGTVPKDKWMLRWWEMKRKLVGVAEPLPRDESYCDPPALFHKNYHSKHIVGLLKYGDWKFVIIFKILKLKSFKLPHRAMLELGRSTSWTRALKEVSGETRMKSKPLLDYFADLYSWLKDDNDKNNRKRGWDVAIDPSANYLKAGLGDEAYAWNSNEMYLFKATIAYAMRQYYLEIKGQQINFVSDNVYTYNEKQRISFFFIVTDPADPVKIIPKADIEAAIKLSRGRINSVFLLDDDTLEFVGLQATLAPPAEQPVTVWLVVFGVVMSLVVVMGVILIVKGFQDRKR